MNQQTKWQASLEALCQNSSGQVTLSFYDEKLRHGFSVGEAVPFCLPVPLSCWYWQKFFVRRKKAACLWRKGGP